MKSYTNCILIAAMLVAFSGLRAQSIPGSAFPVAGNIFSLTEADTAGVVPGAGGTGVTWNFGSLTPSFGSQLDSFMVPSATPYGALFPTATVAVHEVVAITGTNYYVYYYNNTALSTYERIANVQPDTVIYTTPADEYPYPVTGTTTYSGNYYAHYPTSGGSATEAGVGSGATDGTGTLILPTGTYTNVLRVHSNRTEHDTVYTSSTDAALQVDDYYEWYQPNSYYPILSIHYTTLSVMGFTVLNQKTVAYRAGYTSSSPIAPVAVNDNAIDVQPGSVTINVLANDINNNAGDTVCVTGVWGTPAGWETVQGCSDVVFQPLDPNFTGLDTFYYSSCDTHYPTLCDTGMVVVNVEAAGTLQAGFISTGGSCGNEMLQNASVNATSFTWYLTETSPGTFDTVINNVDTLTPFNIGQQFQNATFYICMMARAGNDSSETCDTVQFVCLGVNEIAAAEYKIYPNPASDMIQVDLSHIDQATMASLSDLAVYNMLGQKLKAQSVSQTSIPVGDLSNGVYMIGVIDKNENRKILGKFEVLK